MATSTSNEQVGRIAALARSGRLDEAAVMAASAFAQSRDDPVLAALAGAVETHRGHFARAVTYLEVAHRHRPDDLTVRSNLAEAYFHSAQPAQALALCDDAAARAGPQRRLARLGAHLAQEAGDFARAVALYRLAIEVHPDDWSLWNNLGNALAGQGDHAASADALGKAVALAPDAAPIRINYGNALIEAGRYEEGEQALKDAADANPADAEPVMALATFFRRAGADDLSYQMLAEAARRAPTDPEIQSDLGQEASKRNEHGIAEAAFEAALAERPDLWPSLVGLASLYERTNREAELEPLRKRAEAAGGDAATLSFIDALRLKRANRYEESLAALEAAGEVVPGNRQHQLRGILLDRLGQHDAAFAEFAEMNRRQLSEPSNPAERGRSYHDLVTANAAMLSTEWVANWSPDPVLERPSPVFLLGFPRSGTTLLDTMLMAAPGTLVMEEEPFLPLVEQELGGFDALPGLSEDAIRTGRASYYKKVRKLGAFDDATLIVDKHPLHLNKVPIIRRLFPDARFILALRHPLDVVLSCFLTNFRTNHAMSNFLTLETAAALYDLSFGYWAKAVDIFDLPVTTVVYERLVEDTTRELAPTFEWLGLPLPGADFDHRQTARARGVVRTASYSQVTEPIYTRAAGRWRHYVEHLQPAVPVLQPWIERFGYSLDDGRIPAWGEPALREPRG